MQTVVFNRAVTDLVPLVTDLIIELAKTRKLSKESIEILCPGYELRRMDHDDERRAD